MDELHLNDLRTAVQLGDIKRARKLLDVSLKNLESASYVECKDNLGHTLLFHACRHGSLIMALMLVLEYEANVYAKDRLGCNALMVASAAGHGSVVCKLLQDKAVIRDPINYAAMKDNDGHTMLYHACVGGNLPLVSTLINDYKANVQYDQLHVALSYGRQEVALMLIDKFFGNKGKYLLHSACKSSNLSLVRTLIVKYKYKFDASETNENGDTVLHVAASHGQEEMVTMLINELLCDYTARDQLGRSLLHKACMGGNSSLVKALIVDYKADITARDDMLNTPIHLAASYGHEEVVLMLVKEFRCDLAARGCFGTTVLHHACSSGNDSLIETLMLEPGLRQVLDDYGDSPLTVREFSQHYVTDNFIFDVRPKIYSPSPLFVAALWGKEKLFFNRIYYLIRNGYSSYFSTPLLHRACSGGSVKIIQALLDQKTLFKCFNTFVDGDVTISGNLNMSEVRLRIDAENQHGDRPIHMIRSVAALSVLNKFKCDLNAKGHYGQTLLHIACSEGNINLVRALVALKADIYALDKDMYTPAHVAALYGQDKAVSSLLRLSNFDVNTRGDCFGRSLLHWACIEGRISLIYSLIVEYSADLHLTDYSGNTSWQLASSCVQREVILMFDPNNLPGHLCKYFFHSACKTGSFDVIEAMVDHFAKDHILQDSEGNTPLHVAALHGREDMVVALIDRHHCDPMVKGHQGRSLLHSACAGGNASLVSRLLRKISVFEVDANGNTPLHTCAAFDRVGCLKVLLSKKAPILMLNNSGKTPLNLAKGINARNFLESFLEGIKDKTYHEYSIVQKKAKAKYSKAEKITRIFVIGNPGAGKSTLVENLKREDWFDNFRTISKSSVPLHTAGIIPSIFRSKHYGRVLFYDFAGDPEYYSSHAAILENLASSSKGDNIFFIVVNLEEESSSIANIAAYWSAFINDQSFDERKSAFIVIGSHLDRLLKTEATVKCREFKAICESAKLKVSSFRFSMFMLNCCRPQSEQVIDIQKQIVSFTKDSASHQLSPEAVVLLGLLEKDFSHVVSCSVQTLLSHIRETNIGLPLEAKSLHSLLCELQDIGLLLVIATENYDNMQIVLNVSRMTSDVHKLLFSKGPENVLQSDYGTKHAFNVGIIPLSILENKLPEHITKESLIHLQYCQEISCSKIPDFPTAPHSVIAGESFLFFPALCTAQKSEATWKSPLIIKYSVGWLAYCTENCFPPRFLHVLLLRLVFKFTLSTPESLSQTSSTEHRDFQRRCTMWSTGVHWLMEEGLECMVELVNASKGVVVVLKGGEDTENTYVKILIEIVECIRASSVEFCHTVKYNIFFLDSTDEKDYFNEDNMFAQSDLDKIFASPDKIVAVSVSGNVFSSRPLNIYKQARLFKDKLQLKNNLPASENADASCDLASYVSSLPPVVHPYLENQLDSDNDIDKDLIEIASHVLDCDLEQLVSHLKLTEEDKRDAKVEKCLQLEMLRCEVLRRWKRCQKSQATYRNLLHIFVDAKCSHCAEALCCVLRNKFHPSIRDKPDLFYLEHFKVIKKVASEWKSIASYLRLPRYVIENVHHDTVGHGCVHSSRAIFCSWLDGEGCRPVTWERLIEALTDADWSVLAVELKLFCTKKNDFVPVEIISDDPVFSRSRIQYCSSLIHRSLTVDLVTMKSHISAHN